MPAEQRRALLIDTTVPLLLEYGSDLTTRQIAEAAGIAEGTIFRVFPDKDSLLAAVVEAALDTTELEAALAGIDRSLSLERRLIEAVGFLQERTRRIGALMTATGVSKVPPPSGSATEIRSGIDALAALFEPDRDHLRRTPNDCARALRGLAIASAHPALSLGKDDDPDEIVSLILHGVSAQAHVSHEDEGRSC